jgi:hypothetical protein
MNKSLVLLIAILFMAGAAFAATEVGEYSGPPLVLDEGGPDSVGYYWIDNDGGGGPDYNWIDITDIGEEVLGLADDNNVGPYPFGFDFPYYWYSVSHCWIGSNGYISFSSSANYAHPFSNIPYAGQPNDLVAVLGGDLDYTRPGASCYFYTNNADTVIISWLDVPQFSADHSLDDSTHTLQLILAAGDSSLTFQYGENHGNFAEGGNLADVIGIEDQVGRVGLQYLRNNVPSSHMWHEGLALRFYLVPNPNFSFHDFGIVDGFHDGSGGVFVPVNEAYTLRGLAKNFGTEPEDNMAVRCQIRRGTSPVYNDTVFVEHLEAGESQWVEFGDTFTPDQTGVYRVTFYSILSGDQNTGNNSKNCELESYQLPQELRYCDDTAEDERAWNGDFSGFGVEYQVPEAIELESAGFYINTVAAPGPAYIWILPDDGTGNPDEDNPLAGDTLTVSSTGWKDIDFSSAGLTFQPDEKFYLIVIHAYQSTLFFGMDTGLPLSYRGWEYTGGLAPDRDRETNEIMFRIEANPGTSVDDGGMTPKSFSISQNYPNPFNARTNISFAIDREADVRLGIYNIAGQLVDDLSGHFEAGENMVTWDASSVSSGVYFYKIEYDNNAETRKMVLLK